jgi:hypothetical protein
MRSLRTLHRCIVGASVGLLLVAALGVVASGPAGATPAHVSAAGQEPQDDPDGDPATDDEPVPEQDIIPEPDSGRAPRDAGDRGGALQGLVLVLIVVGVGGIAGVVVRESRRSRSRAAGAAPKEGGAAPTDDRAQASSP